MEFRKDQIQQSYDAGLGLPDKTKQLIADQERDDGAEDGHGGQWNDEGWSGGWWTYEGWNGGWWTNEGWNGGWWSGRWWDQAEEADDADDWTLWRPKNDDGDGDWRGDDWRQDDGDGDWHGGQWDDEGWKGGWWDQAVEEPVLSTDSETEEEAHRRRSGGRGSAGGDQGIAQFNADDLTSGNAEKMLKKFEKRISDHQVPRCEVCTRETYALACRTCGLRICASCELDGSQCECYYWRDRQGWISGSYEGWNDGWSDENASGSRLPCTADRLLQWLQPAPAADSIPEHNPASASGDDPDPDRHTEPWGTDWEHQSSESGEPEAPQQQQQQQGFVLVPFADPAPELEFVPDPAPEPEIRHFLKKIKNPWVCIKCGATNSNILVEGATNYCSRPSCTGSWLNDSAPAPPGRKVDVFDSTTAARPEKPVRSVRALVQSWEEAIQHAGKGGHPAHLVAAQEAALSEHKALPKLKDQGGFNPWDRFSED